MSTSDPLRVLPIAAVLQEAEGSVTELFHRLNSVVPDDQQLVTVPHNMKATEAIRIMRDRGFSQLPVVMGRTVLGVFSYRSFAQAVLNFGGSGSSTDDLLVEECVEDPKYAPLHEDFKPWFGELDRTGYVILGSPDRPQAIVTPMDLLQYLYNVSYPFVLLGEIENALRTLIRRCISEEELKDLASRHRLRHSALEKMGFTEYVTLITEEANWPKFQQVFGGRRTRVQATLDAIRLLRNDVFHFKRELTDSDRNDLERHRNWVLRRARAADELSVGGVQ